MKTTHLSVLIPSLLAAATAIAQTPCRKRSKIEVTGSNIKRVDAGSIRPSPSSPVMKSGVPASRASPKCCATFRRTAGKVTTNLTNQFAPGASGVPCAACRKNPPGAGQWTAHGKLRLRSESVRYVCRFELDSGLRCRTHRNPARRCVGRVRIGCHCGVVNIILRKDYQGFEVGGTAGTSTEGGLNEYRANLGFGFGSIGKDHYNDALGAGSLPPRRIVPVERDFTKDQDFRNRAGGTLTRATVATHPGGQWRPRCRQPHGVSELRDREPD